MTAVRKEVDREPDPGKKVELMKKKLGLVFERSVLTSHFRPGHFGPGHFDQLFRTGHFGWKFWTAISIGHFGPVKLKTIKGKIKKTSERDYYGNRGVKYNWEGISKVVMQEKRTPTECRLKWRNVVHPDIKRDAWTDAEKSQLKKLVRKFGDQGTWAKVIWTQFHLIYPR